MLGFHAAAMIATLLSGVPMLFVGTAVYYALVSKRRFVTTNGVIQNHEQPKNEDGEPIQLRLRYTYCVDGKTFAGRRYYFGSRNECSSDLLKRYPSGSHQIVFYDPKLPSRSTLQVGFRPKLWFWIIATLVFCPLLWIALVAGMVAEWSIDPHGLPSV